MLRFDERDRESVVRDLGSPDAEVRRLAVERASALPAEEVVPRLVERLGDPDWRVRKAAVERLGACRDTDVVAVALIAALADGDNPGRRNAAVEALIHGGPTSLPRLVLALASQDVDVRKFAVDSLAGIGHEDAIEPLVARLQDADPNVRAAAADALGAIGGEGAARALMSAATDEGQEGLVRFSALHALAHLERPVRASELASVLDDPVLGPAGLGLLGVAEGDELAAEVLLKGLSASGRALREAAMRSLLRLLSRLDGRAADRLVEQIRVVAGGAPIVVEGAVERLGDADLATRLVLIQFLGLLRAPRAAVPVLLAGRDEALSQVAEAALVGMGDAAEEEIDAAFGTLDADARRAACSLFGKTGGRAGATRLIGQLDDPDPGLRAAAASAIGERRLVEALPALAGRLERLGVDDDLEDLDELEEERLAITQALVALARARGGAEREVAARVIELLTSMLSGAAENVRLAIATVLGRIGRHEDVDVVELLLKDVSAAVRRAAVEALAHLEPGVAVEPLRLALADESPIVRIAAAGALGASRSDAVFEDLRRLASDEDARVRATAVGAIALRFAAHPEPDIRAAALAVVHRVCEDEAPVALAAIESLREVGGAAAAYVMPLLRRPEPELVHEAVRCVGRHGGARELEELIPLVSHPEWSVRAEAIQALADRRVRKAVPAILRRLEVEQDEFVRGQTLRALEALEG